MFVRGVHNYFTLRLGSNSPHVSCRLILYRFCLHVVGVYSYGSSVCGQNQIVQGFLVYWTYRFIRWASPVHQLTIIPSTKSKLLYCTEVNCVSQILGKGGETSVNLRHTLCPDVPGGFEQVNLAKKWGFFGYFSGIFRVFLWCRNMPISRDFRISRSCDKIVGLRCVCSSNLRSYSDRYLELKNNFTKNLV